MTLEKKHIIAPELYGDYWLNSEPVVLKDNIGSVIIIDFWDYTCTNSIRSLPYINEWYKKYKEYGVKVIGVHTPEFEFAKLIINVENAVKKFGIEYPIVLDNEAKLWSAYGVRHWPTRFIIDKYGFVRFVQYGEGGYLEFERVIQQVLIEAGSRCNLPALETPMRLEDQENLMCYKPTGELYLGYLRGALGNPEGYNPESTLEYADPGIYIAERFYATGKWKNEKQCLRFDGSEGEEGSILFSYQAKEVNAVMRSRDGSICEVLIKQNGQILPKEILGKDAIHTSKGASVFVDTPRMHQLVQNRKFGSNLLKLTTNNPNLEIYSFSFVTSIISELVQTCQN